MTAFLFVIVASSLLLAILVFVRLLAVSGTSGFSWYEDAIKSGDKHVQRIRQISKKTLYHAIHETFGTKRKLTRQINEVVYSLKRRVARYAERLAYRLSE